MVAMGRPTEGCQRKIVRSKRNKILLVGPSRKHHIDQTISLICEVYEEEKGMTVWIALDVRSASTCTAQELQGNMLNPSKYRLHLPPL